MEQLIRLQWHTQKEWRWFFEWTKSLCVLGDGREKLTVKKLQKHFVKGIEGFAKVKYIDKGGNELPDKDAVLDLVLEIIYAQEAEAELRSKQT